MNIPLLHELNIPFFHPIEEKGFLAVGFKPFYNPGILVCDRDESDPTDLPIACKGVLIRVDTENNHVFVGEGGIEGRVALLSGNTPSRLRRVWYKDENVNKYIPGWTKAILLFDWENDIKTDKDLKEFLITINEEISSEENKEEAEKKAAQRVESKIDELMKKEIKDLIELLLFEISNLENFHLTNTPVGKTYSAPKSSSQRHEDYVAVVKEILRLIDEQRI